MKKSLFTMALVAAGAVIYLLSKDKEEKNETPEIRLIDLKKDNNESENHNDSAEDSQEEKEEPEMPQESEEETEPEPVKEEPVLSPEENFSDLMSELKQELQTEDSEAELSSEEAEPEAEIVPEESAEAEMVEEPAEEPGLPEDNELLSNVEEDEAEVEKAEEVPAEPAENEQSEESENLFEPDHSEPLQNADEAETSVEDEEEPEQTESDSVIKDLQGKILNEVEQEIKDNNFGDFVRGKEQSDDEPRYSGTVYEVSDLYPYLSYEMIDKILDANIGFNHVYHDSQPIKIIHRVGFDKIEDLIEFVILIKEHDYRVEENNGLDMISISKDLVVEDTIIISDIFNVSNQVYRLHGHYQGYEIVEQ